MKATLDARPASRAYAAAFQRLRGMGDFKPKAILRAEMGSILKAWAGRTSVSTEAQIDRRARARVAHALGLSKADQNSAHVTINNGARGGFPGEMWFRTRNKRYQQAGRILPNGNFVASNIHFRAADWPLIRHAGEQYGSLYTRRRAAGLKSAGLARQSVIQIADQLGINLNDVAGGGISAAGIAKARAAIASSGGAYTNGTGRESGDEIRSWVEGFTHLPYGQKIGMDRTLLSVVSGRAKYIQTAYAKGAFDGLRKEAAAFPNIFKVGQLS